MVRVDEYFQGKLVRFQGSMFIFRGFQSFSLETQIFSGPNPTRHGTAKGLLTSQVGL